MAGGLAGLTEVFTPAEAVRLNELGDRLRERLNALAAARRAPLQATGVGSLIGLHLVGLTRTAADPKVAHAATARLALEDLFHLDNPMRSASLNIAPGYS